MIEGVIVLIIAKAIAVTTYSLDFSVCEAVSMFVSSFPKADLKALGGDPWKERSHQAWVNVWITTRRLVLRVAGDPLRAIQNASDLAPRGLRRLGY